MKFYRIKLTAWRDRVERQAAAKRNAEVGQTEAQLAELQQLAEAERKSKGVNVEALKSIEASIAEVTGRRAEVMTEEERKAEGVAVAAGLHPKVGTEGYQIIDDKLGQVVGLVDADGNDFDPGAAFEYDIVETDVAAPAWWKGEEAR